MESNAKTISKMLADITAAFAELLRRNKNQQSTINQMLEESERHTGTSAPQPDEKLEAVARERTDYKHAVDRLTERCLDLGRKLSDSMDQCVKLQRQLDAHGPESVTKRYHDSVVESALKTIAARNNEVDTLRGQLHNALAKATALEDRLAHCARIIADKNDRLDRLGLHSDDADES